MIVGLGTDLCSIARIERVLARHGDRFRTRCFSRQEQEAARRRAEGARLAQFFAAKEACSKALGTGLRRGTYWRDMEVFHLPSGQPQLRLSGQAAAHAARLCPPSTAPHFVVSLADEQGFAVAVVILSARAVPNSNSNSDSESDSDSD